MVVAPESLAQLSEAQLRETLATLMQAMQRRDTELAFKQTVIDKLTHENAVLKRLKFAAQSERYSAEQSRAVLLRSIRVCRTHTPIHMGRLSENTRFVRSPLLGFGPGAQPERYTDGLHRGSAVRVANAGRWTTFGVRAMLVF